MALVAILAASAIGVHGWSRWTSYVDAARQLDPVAAAPVAEPTAALPVLQSGADVDERPSGRTTVQQDETGRVLEVRGANPEAVLIAFCAAQRDPAPCDPVELATAWPGHSGVRIGIYRGFDDLSRLNAIRIRRDRRSGRWVAGDGTGPVVSYAANQLRMSEPRAAIHPPYGASLASLGVVFER